MICIRSNKFFFKASIYCILSLLLFTFSCGKQEAPPPATPHPARIKTAPTVTNITQTTVTQPTETIEDKSVSKAAEKFKSYERKVKNGEISSAESILKEIRSYFSSETEYKAFWNKSMPQATRTKLTISVICDSCRGGICSECGGKKSCSSCNGKKTCILCQGQPVKKINCIKCICSTCSGTGRCKTCKGARTIMCDACQTFGMIEKNIDIPCKRCGGTGQINGLKGNDGNPMKSMCILCKGRGSTSRTVASPCSVCNGQGSMACSDCKGSGKCNDCTGGRRPNCTGCKGTGIINETCPKCKGTGKCDICNGTGKCIKCSGTGKCNSCIDGIIPLHELPIDTEWLKNKFSAAVYDNTTRKILDQKTESGPLALRYKDITINVQVESGQLLWISNSEMTDGIKEIMNSEK